MKNLKNLEIDKTTKEWIEESLNDFKNEYIPKGLILIIHYNKNKKIIKKEFKEKKDVKILQHQH